MDCESCGRYRPSSEIVPLRDPDGRLLMACARCRRVISTRGSDRFVTRRTGIETGIALVSPLSVPVLATAATHVA